MFLELINGCTKNEFTVNGEDFNVYDTDEQKDILFSVVEKLLSISNPRTILESLMETYSEIDFGEPCDQCGDTVKSYTLIL